MIEQNDVEDECVRKVFAKLIAEELYNIIKKYPLTQGEKKAISCAITNLFKRIELNNEIESLGKEDSKLLLEIINF